MCIRLANCTSFDKANVHHSIRFLLMFSQSNLPNAHLLPLQMFYGVQMESMSAATPKMDADLIPVQPPVLWTLR